MHVITNYGIGSSENLEVKLDIAQGPTTWTELTHIYY